MHSIKHTFISCQSTAHMTFAFNAIAHGTPFSYRVNPSVCLSVSYFFPQANLIANHTINQINRCSAQNNTTHRITLHWITTYSTTITWIGVAKAMELNLKLFSFRTFTINLFLHVVIWYMAMCVCVCQHARSVCVK